MGVWILSRFANWATQFEICTPPVVNLEGVEGVSGGVASLSLPDGQDKNISSIFLHFHRVFLIFPQIFFILFLILVFWVGGSPTWTPGKAPGYATGGCGLHIELLNKLTYLKFVLPPVEYIFEVF